MPYGVIVGPVSRSQEVIEGGTSCSDGAEIGIDSPSKA
jgi:hypothetical protein